MHRIRYYGPALVLLLTLLAVMTVGPQAARQMAWAQADHRIALIRSDLDSNPTLAELSSAFRQVAQVVEPSVVHIQSFERGRSRQSGGARDFFFGPQDELLRRFFGPMMPEEQVPPDQDMQERELDRYNVPRERGAGSGWVYDAQGHIVTNNHVIANADRVMVRFSNGSEYEAEVVGTDPRTDVAVLRIDADSLHPAAIAEHEVEQGDMVFAFGSPFGNEFSMSQGIISGKGRQIGLLVSRGGYENFIQTDAAINPGNSGGPLTNIYGQVVGMNTAIATRSGGSEGIGYVIPVRMVTHVVDQLIDTGRVSRGYLGIGIDELTPAMARSFGYEGRGILVTQPLEDGPAGLAGVESGDIITAVDGRAVASIEQFRENIAAMPPGTTVTLTIFRGGETLEVEVELGELPDQIAAAQRPGQSEPRDAEPGRDMLLKLGFQRLSTLTAPIAQRLNIDAQTTGVLIGAVRPGSVAAAEGLQRGMVITHVMNEPIENVEQFIETIAAFDPTEGIRVRVMFGGNVRYVLLVLPED